MKMLFATSLIAFVLAMMSNLEHERNLSSRDIPVSQHLTTSLFPTSKQKKRTWWPEQLQSKDHSAGSQYLVSTN
jgi:hypothetical protein